jgi:heptosyltransferase-1
LGKRFLDVGLTPAFFWGSDEEKQRVERLAQKIGSSVVLPRMRLADCAAVIAKARAMIGVDTGLAHLGAALAVPSVGIIVGTSAQLFSLVSEGKAVTVGDKGVVPSVDAVWRAYEEVVK